MRAGLASAVVCLALVASQDASAARPEDLGLEFATAVKDDAAAALVVRPRLAVKSATFTINGPTGTPTVQQVGALRQGSTKRLPIAHGEGRATYHGTAEVRWAAGGAATYTFEFEAVRYRTLKMTMAWEDVDLVARTATCRPSHAVSAIEVVLAASDGRVLSEARRELDPPAAAGEPLTIGWDPIPGDEAPATITVKVIDDLGVWASMKATPFTISIPHDEVEFALGSDAIDPDEAGKLEATLTELRAALRRHGTLLDLKLFIAGYTDTVGPPGANVALSVRRAAAIARWFRAHGVRLPIYYRGFGEASPAVATPDETDEPKNRRALYILSVHPPLGERVAAADGAAGWARLVP